LGRVVAAAALSPLLRRQGRPFVAVVKTKDLIDLMTLIEAGKLTPVIGTTVPLIETPPGFGQHRGGHARGKVVITL
jgi:NADPH:quinone reductase-like Zn-dependent oxidoreductase